jgi:hypothetical protein
MASLAARVAPAPPADGRGRTRVASRGGATCRGVAVTARASTSGQSPEPTTPGAVVRAVLGADEKAWTHIVSSPEGREMVEMSPRALTMRLLALRDALGSVSRTHDLDVAGMVMEQPSLATLPGDADDSVRRAWRVLEATFPDVDLAERAQACPCAFAHVLRRSIDLASTLEGEDAAAFEDVKDVKVADDVKVKVAAADVEKRLGATLRGWLRGDAWFGVFSSCVGSEWGYLRTMSAYATKSVEGTTLESFRKGSAYKAKNKQLRPLTSHIREPVRAPAPAPKSAPY